MKKLISIVLVFVMLFSVAVVPAFAGYYDPEQKGDSLYFDKFIEQEIDSTAYTLVLYFEDYYHIDADGNIDWVWVYAVTGPTPDVESEPHFIILNDKVVGANWDCPVFFSGYGIYDAKKDKFFDIIGLDFSEYDGIDEYIDQNLGRKIGDADGDNELTILDATFVQMATAKLCEYSASDYFGGYGYLSDVNRDGQRDILDATAIQLKLAGIE